jgi:hypothetical protein
VASSWSAPEYTFQMASLPTGETTGETIDFTRTMSAFAGHVYISESAYFILWGSFDGITWFQMFNALSSGAMTAGEAYFLAPFTCPARYVRGVISSEAALTADFAIVGIEQGDGFPLSQPVP